MAEIRSAEVRVLIVDDSPSDQAAFRRHLIRGAHRPFTVTAAGTVSEALASLAASPPDCVLIDFNLPEVDGLTFVRQIVETHGAHAFGIVMLTSAAETAVAVKALQYGAHDYLEKNVADGTALRRAVENAVDKAAIQRELHAKSAALEVKNAELLLHVDKLEQEMADRKRAEDALRRSETQLRLITDHASVLLAQVDVHHRYKFANRAYAERYHLSVQEVVGAHVADVVGPEAYHAALPEITAALAGNRVEFEKEIPYHDLGPRWLHVVFMPERDAAGNVAGFVAVLSDLTDRKQEEQELKLARDQALAGSRAKDEFLARLSHELRTPLSPVLLLASEAAANTSLPPEVRADFHIIRKNVDLEARLIDDLLDITRISRGKLALTKRKVSVHTVLHDALVSVQSEAIRKPVQLKLDLTAAQYEVMGDAVRLQQIFWNLLNNAVKFTPAHGVVQIHTQVHEGALEVSVEDSGIGLSEEEIAGIFEAFSQGEHSWPNGSHQFGGLGLGLAISRMLVEMHEGRIRAVSAGRHLGAKFIVTLPLACGLNRAEPVPDEGNLSGPPLTPEHPTASLKILIVEDHEPTRNALQLLLGRRGHAVTVACSVEEARRIAGAGKFDLLISDIGLPDGNGYELMEELHLKYGLKAIALTGYGMDQDIARSVSAGFLAHLTKPVRIQELEAVISKVNVTPS